jgi:hypothetical protein
MVRRDTSQTRGANLPAQYVIIRVNQIGYLVLAQRFSVHGVDHGGIARDGATSG